MHPDVGLSRWMSLAVCRDPLRVSKYAHAPEPMWAAHMLCDNGTTCTQHMMMLACRTSLPCSVLLRVWQEDACYTHLAGAGVDAHAGYRTTLRHVGPLQEDLLVHR